VSDRLRLLYSKTGKAKYISHLDLMAVMRRALTRAGISLKYSEGFNPHPYMSVALPLSVGYESVCELMDFKTSQEALPENLPGMLSDKLPEGLKILEAYAPERKFDEIAWVKVSGLMYYDTGAAPGTAELLVERFAEGSIVIQKKTKRGISDIDIAPFIRDAVFISNEPDPCDRRSADVCISAELSAQDPTINPDNLISALEGEYISLKPDFTSFARQSMFDKNHSLFR